MAIRRCRPMFTALACLAAGFIVLGCDEEDLPDKVKKGVQKVKQVAAPTRTTTKPAAAASEIALSVAGNVKVSECHATLIALPDRGKQVLKLASYADPDQEKFPSVFLWAEVSEQSPVELTGKKIAAQLFVQPTRDGPIWRTLRGEEVEVSFPSVTTSSFTAEITSGKVVNTETGAAVDVGGTFTGAFDTTGQ